MPLWTIFTKWPAPLGPQCSQPRSAGDGSPLCSARAGVRSATSGPRGERVEDRGQSLDGAVGAADHQAVAPFETVHAAAGADVEVVDAVVGGERRGAVDVVVVPGVAAVDDRVAGRQQRCQGADRRVDERRRHHDPDCPRHLELGDERRHVGGRLDALGRHGLDAVDVDVVADALVAGPFQSTGHVGAHSAESDHAQLHRASLADDRRARSPGHVRCQR